MTECLLPITRKQYLWYVQLTFSIYVKEFNTNEYSSYRR